MARRQMSPSEVDVNTTPGVLARVLQRIEPMGHMCVSTAYGMYSYI